MFRWFTTLVALILVASSAIAATKPPSDSLLKSAGLPIKILAGQKAAITVPGNTYQLYYFDLRSNTVEFRAVTSGAVVDIDMFLKRGVPQSGTSFQALVQESQYTAIGTSGNETLLATRTSNPALTAGRWWIAVLNPDQSPQSFDLAITTPQSGPMYTLGQGQSGAWYEAAKNYQGIFFEVIAPNTALIIWFTYDLTGQQAFFTGVGTFDGDRLIIQSLTKTRGGRFGAAFNASQVVREDWGSLVFTFESCGRGYASYTPTQAAFNAGWPYEQLNTERLASIAGLPCGGASAAREKHLINGASGTWYVPSRDGEGWLVETLSSSLAIVYWFSYTPDGQQAWFGGVGTIENGNITVADALQPTGGRFGPSYSPSQVTLNPWGFFSLTFISCSDAVAAAGGPQAYGFYQYPGVSRLTNLVGTPACASGATTSAISATASVPANSYVDGDVNDPNTPFVANSPTPQLIQNPALVAGFATKTPTGQVGDRFQSGTDEFDFYQLTIVGGQSIQLAISDWAQSTASTTDLDLFLYTATSTPTLLQSSEGTGQSESISVGATGQYIIGVRAFAGRSNYILSVSSATTMASSVDKLSRMGDFVDGEVIVDFHRPPKGSKATLKSLQQRADELGLKAEGGMAEMAMLFSIGAGSDADKALKALGVSGESEFPSPYAETMAPFVEQARVVRALKALRGRSDVNAADPNYRVYPRALREPNDPGYPFQAWHYRQANLPQAWGVTTGNQGVVVAIIDGGVAPHPDLLPNVDYALGWNFKFPGQPAYDDALIVGGRSSWHGTHVAGTVAARGNDGIGVAGVSWTATIMPIRYGELDIFRNLVDPIRYAAGLTNGSGRVPSRRAQIANLSYGQDFNPACPSTVQSAINDAFNAGLAIVVASGNHNTRMSGIPDSCANIINVAATGYYGERASYSNCGPTISLAAPGGSAGNPGLPESPFQATACSTLDSRPPAQSEWVLSTIGEPPYVGAEAGTSMATPHVSGILALMESVNPGLTPAQVNMLIASGRITNDAGPQGRDDFFGYGVIDALKAVSEAQALAGGSAPPAVATVTPTTLSFGENASSLGLRLSASGTGPLAVTGISSNAQWLSVSPAAVNSQGFGDYNVVVNRSGLPSAGYSGRLSFATSTAGALNVSVTMQVGAANSIGNVGAVYALLIDPYTLNTVAFGLGTYAQGRYTFAVSGVLPGQYYLVAGSDIDHDNSICDPGEACGFYPSSGDAELITVPQTGALPPFTVTPDVGGLGTSVQNSALKQQAAGLRGPISLPKSRSTGFARGSVTSQLLVQPLTSKFAQ